MFGKLLTFAVHLLVRGPGKSWVFTSGALGLAKAVRKGVGRHELIDVSDIRPGDKIVIEHLKVTHKDQLKDEKRRKKSDKRARRATKKAVRAAKRAS